MAHTSALRSVALVAALAASACARDAGPALTRVELGAGPGAAEPNLALDADGAVLVSWLEPAGQDTHALRFARRPAGGAWSEPSTIASGAHWFVNWADFPSVVRVGDATLAAHWLVRSGPGTYAYDIAMALSTDNGATWSEPFRPHTDGTETEHGFVSLFEAPAGGVGAVWLDGREMEAGSAEDASGPDDGHGGGGGAMTLRYARFGDASGEPLDGFLLDERTCDCCQTDAARAGDAVLIAYRDRGDDEVRDIVVRRGTRDGWEEPTRVHDDDWRIPACPVNGPAIAASGDHAAIAWFTAARDTPRVNVAFSDDGGRSFGAPVRVDGGSPEGRVDLQLVGNAAAVSWLERTADGAEVRVRLVEEGRAGAPLVITQTGAERASGFPRFVRAGDELVFAWTRAGDPSRVLTAALPLDRLPRP